MAELMGGEDEHRAWRTIAVLVTSVRDGFEHLVNDAAMTPGSAGRYVALCGRAVQAAALVCPPGPRCPACVAVRNAVPADGRRHRRTDQRGVWARLTAGLRGPRSAQSESAQLPDLTLPLLNDGAPEATRPNHEALVLSSPVHRDLRR